MEGIKTTLKCRRVPLLYANSPQGLQAMPRPTGEEVSGNEKDHYFYNSSPSRFRNDW